MNTPPRLGAKAKANEADIDRIGVEISSGSAFMTNKLNEADDVMWAAQILGISERQLFEQAFLFTHRHAASNDQMEVFYTPYRVQGTAPPWVTRFARQVLCDHSSQPGPRIAGPCTTIRFTFELGLELYIRPHSPETLGPDRYRTLVA